MNNALITRCLVVFLFMVFNTAITQGQTNQNTYNNKKAKLELSEIQKKLQTGASVTVHTELLEYLYENRGHFPEMTDKMTVAEKIQELVTVQTQLTRLLYTLQVRSVDSVSYKHALTMISLGYISAQLMPLANEFMRTFDKKEETYEIRLNGMRQAFYGMKNMLVGYLLTAFVENKNQEVTPMFIANVNDFGPSIFQALPGDIRKETLISIKKTIEPQVRSDLREQYQKFVEKL